MSNKFPDQEPERHEMKHIGDGEFFCPICYRQVRLVDGRLEVVRDSNGKPMAGDIFAIHSGGMGGIEVNLQLNPNEVPLDPDIWENWWK